MRLEGDYVSLAPLPRLCFGGGESTDVLSIATFGEIANTLGNKFRYFDTSGTKSHVV